MTRFKGENLNDRLSSAAASRKALLEKFQARPNLDDPDVAERRSEREAIHKAREERLAEREAVRLAEAAAKQAADAKALLDDQVAREAAALEKAAQAAQLENEQKAARDARYAARKARK